MKIPPYCGVDQKCPSGVDSAISYEFTTESAELGTRYLKSYKHAAIWQKSSGAAACRYLNKKVEPLPLLAYKTAAAAATLEKYLAKRTIAFKEGIL